MITKSNIIRYIYIIKKDVMKLQSIYLLILIILTCWYRVGV